MQLIETRPGRATAVVNALDAPMALYIDGWGGFFGFNAIVTDISGELAGNVAITHTALDLSYLYVFGDKPGPLSIAGMAFVDTCFAPGGATGIERVLDFYMSNRVAMRSAPCQIQIGAGAGGYFQGFLLGLKFGIARPEARVADFALQYLAMPRIRGAG